jgi:hypothetical protein
MTETPGEPTTVENTEDELSDALDSSEPTDAPEEPAEEDDEPDTFPREVVEKLRQENGKYRQRAQRADTLAERLHTELVRATGRLADPSDLQFAEEHLDDPDALVAAVDELLERKPHLASRKPAGDIGQGPRGTASEPFSLLGLLKERT